MREVLDVLVSGSHQVELEQEVEVSSFSYEEGFPRDVED